MRRRLSAVGAKSASPRRCAAAMRDLVPYPRTVTSQIHLRIERPNVGLLASPSDAPFRHQTDILLLLLLRLCPASLISLSFSCASCALKCYLRRLRSSLLAVSFRARSRSLPALGLQYTATNLCPWTYSRATTFPLLRTTQYPHPNSTASRRATSSNLQSPDRPGDRWSCVACGMVGLWLTEGKGKHAVESMAWLGGKWKSSEVLLIVRGMEQTLSRERVLQKLSPGMDASKAFLAWLMERKGRKVEIAVMERWGLLSSDGLSAFEQRR